MPFMYLRSVVSPPHLYFFYVSSDSWTTTKKNFLSLKWIFLWFCLLYFKQALFHTWKRVDRRTEHTQTYTYTHTHRYSITIMYLQEGSLKYIFFKPKKSTDWFKKQKVLPENNSPLNCPCKSKERGLKLTLGKVKWRWLHCCIEVLHATLVERIHWTTLW